MNDDATTIHAQLLAILAKRYSMVEREDISQELWLGYYASKHAPEGPEKPADGLEDEDAWSNYKTELKALRREMEAAAKKYCRTEKAALEGYEYDDELFYGISSLKALLETWFACGVIETPPRTHENSVSRPTRSGRYGDYLVSLIDVSVALKRLKPHQKAILFYGYSPAFAGRTDEEIALELRSKGWQGMSLATFNRKIGHALRALQRQLGGTRF